MHRDVGAATDLNVRNTMPEFVDDQRTPDRNSGTIRLSLERMHRVTTEECPKTKLGMISMRNGVNT